jgi:DNA invertase Pin-like site-specific DNA recombinase
MISQRTTDALAAAKQRGVRLGSPTTPAILSARSDAFAEGLRPIVGPMIAGNSLRAIAGCLNAAGHKTANGGAWSAMTVSRLVERLKA